MANTMKITVNSTGPAPLIGNLTSSITTNTVGATPAGPTSIALTTVTGTGSGGVADVTIDGTGVVSWVVVTTAGDGYEVGDTVSIANDGSVPAIITLVQANLDVDVLLGGTAYIPVENAICAQPSSAANAFVDIREFQTDHNRFWRLTIDGGTAGNLTATVTAINTCLQKAWQAPNSQPNLADFLPNGVGVTNVQLS